MSSSDQTRCTVAGLTPTRFAIERHDQCVWPGGTVLAVSSTISAIFSSLITGLRPRPIFTVPQPDSPSVSKADRQARTVTAVTPC